jgi:hypothetical protein
MSQIGVLVYKYVFELLRQAAAPPPVNHYLQGSYIYYTIYIGLFSRGQKYELFSFLPNKWGKIVFNNRMPGRSVLFGKGLGWDGCRDRERMKSDWRGLIGWGVFGGGGGCVDFGEKFWGYGVTVGVGEGLGEVGKLLIVFVLIAWIV